MLSSLFYLKSRNEGRLVSYIEYDNFFYNRTAGITFPAITSILWPRCTQVKWIGNGLRRFKHFCSPYGVNLPLRGVNIHFT